MGKSRKSKAYKKRRSYKKRGGGCGCMKNTPVPGSGIISGGNGYSNMQNVGVVPYSYNNELSPQPPSSNYGGNNADLYSSGMGKSIAGGASKYRKRKGSKRKTNKRVMKGGMINWNNMDPILAASGGTYMQPMYYMPSNYVPPPPLA
jgi:hypothetical protein